MDKYDKLIQNINLPISLNEIQTDGTMFEWLPEEIKKEIDRYILWNHRQTVSKLLEAMVDKNT